MSILPLEFVESQGVLTSENSEEILTLVYDLLS
jgi:hypothetical protein